jgi:hypothetical protein
VREVTALELVSSRCSCRCRCDEIDGEHDFDQCRPPRRSCLRCGQETVTTSLDPYPGEER